MYIYKMVFVEREQLSEEAIQILEETELMPEVDYGNVEIQSYAVKEVINGDYPLHKYEYSQNQVIDALKELGDEEFEALKNGDIDYVQVIY